MTTDPMVEWLTKTLDEVEARAKAPQAVAESPWSVTENVGGDRDVVVAASALKMPTNYPVHELWGGEGSDHVYGSEEVATHVAYFDPATVLRHVAGAREMLELHGSYPDGGCRACDDGYQRPMPWPCDNLYIEAERWGWTG